jgi:hypothetical protein
MIREYAETRLKEGKVTVDQPLIKEESNSVIAVFYGPNGPIDASDPPLTVILDEQFRLSNLRTAKTPVPELQWKKMLDDVEAEVAKMVDDFHAGLDADELAKRIADRSESIHFIYNDAMRQYAKSQGKSLAPYAENRRFYVEVRSNPSGGSIKYMPSGHWDIYNFLVKTKKQTDIPQPAWISLVQKGPISFAANGHYYFHVRWEVGKPEFNGTVQITERGTLTLSPEGYTLKE